MLYEGVEYQGLSLKEVNQRIKEGKVNVTNDKDTNSNLDIVRRNLFTFFNLIYIIIFILILMVSSFRNLLFIFVAVSNTAIGVYQQIKAKRILDQVKLVTIDKCKVVREGKLEEVKVDEIVIDDLLILERGNQVPCDAVVVNGQLELNESLLTGESEPVNKNISEEVLSGSYVTSGNGLVKTTMVGNESYSSRLSRMGKVSKQAPSELKNSINKILKVVSFLIIILSIVIFYREIYIQKASTNQTILIIASAVLGMIPSGLVLLTSVAFALSSVRLSRNNALIQEPNAIEALARTNVLCLDKTGTLTNGQLAVVDVIKYSDDFDDAIGNLLNALNDNNATLDAIRKHFEIRNNLKPIKTIAFSSARKYSGVIFEQYSYYLGAYEFITNKKDKDILELISNKAKLGYRVISVFRDQDTKDLKPIKPVLIGLILIRDTIRDKIGSTVKFLEKNGVTIKVISGDDPLTTSAIAQRAKVKKGNVYCDMSKVKTDDDYRKVVEGCAVFGRVTPNQKAKLIKTMKELNYHPAMVGDGVNDILALKEADCGIAMMSGSDASRHAADIVLLDDNFEICPYIIKEGCRVINNITLSSSMYLVKTIFSVLLAIMVLVFSVNYPFEPIQLSILSAFLVGLPTLIFTTFEPNYNQVKGKYFSKVVFNSLPPAISILICIMIVPLIGNIFELDQSNVNTLVFIVTAFNYVLALLKVYSPINRFRLMIIGGLLLLLILISSVFSKFFLFNFNFFSIASWFILASSIILSFVIQNYLRKFIGILLPK